MSSDAAKCGRWRAFVAILLLSLFTTPTMAQDIERLSGIANTTDGERLPEDAVLEVDLLEVPRTGEKAIVLSRMQFIIENDVPIPFDLAYDNRLIRRRAVYSVSARVKLGADVLYRSTAIQPVLTRGLDPRPEIVMERVVPIVSSGTPVGERWRVARIDGIENLGFTKAVIIFDTEGEVSGNAGCNRYTAPYDIEGQELEFGNIDLTLRGCTSRIKEREEAFLKAMRRTVTYLREGDVLKLFDISDLETMRLDLE